MDAVSIESIEIPKFEGYQNMYLKASLISPVTDSIWYK